MRIHESCLLEEALSMELMCSTAHIRWGDSYLLNLLAEAGPEKDWLVSMPHGHIIRLKARRFPVLELKKRGFSRAIRLLAAIALGEGCRSLYICADGIVLDGLETFEW